MYYHGAFLFLVILGSMMCTVQGQIGLCQMVDVPDVRGNIAQYESAGPGLNLESCKAVCLADVTCMSTEFRPEIGPTPCLFSTQIVDTEASDGDTVSFKVCSDTTTPEVTTTPPTEPPTTTMDMTTTESTTPTTPKKPYGRYGYGRYGRPRYGRYGYRRPSYGRSGYGGYGYGR